jgi:threonine synthase
MDPIAHLGSRVGDTPLVTSKSLIERTGLTGLRLKLEGMNPTGTQKDRIAHLEVKEALSHNAPGITTASCGNFGVALAHASHVTNLPCTIVVPETFEGERVELMQRLGAKVVREGKSYEEAIIASRKYAQDNDYHNANPGGTNTLRVIAGYGTIAEEILRRSKTPPKAIGVAVGNGTTLAGLHSGFRSAWSDGKINEVPKMIGGTSQGNNPLPAVWARGQKNCDPLDPRAVDETRVNEPLVNWDALDGTAALTAVRDSRGAAYGFDDATLMEYHDLLLKDGYDAHPASLAAVAALAVAADEGLIDKDQPVIAVLTSGRSTIHVETISQPEPDIDHMVQELKEWLGRFDDPTEEVIEAVQRAFDNGHVLVARDANGRLGYVTLTPMDFESFFPKYHLSYIAVDPRARGRGVGTLLMEEAIRITKGNVSLHVETDNTPAIKLYEKFGFHAKYYRMIYDGPAAAVDPASGSGWMQSEEAEKQASNNQPAEGNSGNGPAGKSERPTVALKKK